MSELQPHSGWTKNDQQQAPKLSREATVGPRVLVCGGRDYMDAAFEFRVLDEMHYRRPFSLLIHGACKDKDDVLCGADRIAEEWAIARSVPYVGVPAQWHLHGRAAGPIRNGEMLAQWKPDVVVALPGGRGTADMTNRAQRAGLEVRIEARPERVPVPAVDPSRSTP